MKIRKKFRKKKKNKKIGKNLKEIEKNKKNKKIIQKNKNKNKLNKRPEYFIYIFFINFSLYFPAIHRFIQMEKLKIISFYKCWLLKVAYLSFVAIEFDFFSLFALNKMFMTFILVNFAWKFYLKIRTYFFFYKLFIQISILSIFFFSFM